MSIIKLVPKNKVLKTAFKLINQAKNTLHLTIILEEEINTISDSYLRLIDKKLSEGITVKRIGFGSKRNYQKACVLFKTSLYKEKFIFKHYPNLKTALRMLIVDEKKMLFAIYINKKDKLVFYTNSQLIVNGFLNYFNEIFDKI